MFDVINGLPVHILVIHLVVVLLPLMALVTIAFTVRPRWRDGGLPWAIAGNAVAVVAAIVAKESGEKLQTRLSVRAGQKIAADHAERGDVLPLFAFGLLIASLIALLLVRRRTAALTAAAIALVVVAGAGATYWTYLTGDSGAKAVWEGSLEGTVAPK